MEMRPYAKSAGIVRTTSDLEEPRMQNLTRITFDPM